jgi:hypothetical protein
MLVLLNTHNDFDMLRRVRFVDSIKQRENARSILAFIDLKGMTCQREKRRYTHQPKAAELNNLTKR